MLIFLLIKRIDNINIEGEVSPALLIPYNFFFYKGDDPSCRWCTVNP